MAFYVYCDDNSRHESMTKEQILTAIAQAIQTGKIGDCDTGFITTIKEKNEGKALSFWVGTQAQYNALPSVDKNCHYIKTDDTTVKDLESAIAKLDASVTEQRTAVQQLDLKTDVETERVNQLVQDVAGLSGSTITPILEDAAATEHAFAPADYDILLIGAKPASANTTVCSLVPSAKAAAGLTFQVSDDANYSKFELTSTGISRITGTGSLTYIYGLKVYNETEIHTWQDLNDRLQIIEGNELAGTYVETEEQNLTEKQKVQTQKNLGIHEWGSRLDALEERGNNEGIADAYLYTSFSAAVADLNASTTENADATDENAVCAIYTDSAGNTNLMLLSDIELTETIEFTVPVIFDLNSYTVNINGDYRIRLRADNSIIDGRNGGQIIKETTINSVSYSLYFSGNNCKLLGGYYSMTAPADTKLISCVMANGESFLIDGAEIYTEVTSGNKSTYCVVGQKGIHIVNSVISGMSLSGNIYCVNSQSKENTAFIINSEITATLESGISDTAAYALSGHKISVEKSKISAQSTNRGVIGINVASDLTISDCEISIDSETGSGQCLTIQSGCTATAENSTFFADGTTGSVSEGNENYAGTQGIANEGTLYIKNCNVYGTHAGLQCGSSAITKINGGLYEGPGHGGIYICTVAPGQFYAENCTVRAVPYRGKHKDMYFYGNNLYIVAAVYIGGGDGIKAYFDNCVMDGGGPERMPDYDTDGTLKGYMGAEPIRFRQSNDEKNNAAYISNCTLMGDGKIRFANATHSLHLGFYNRILCEPSLESCMVDEGRVVYTGYEESVTV